MANRILYVKQTNNIELAEKWGFDFSPSFRGELFIRCNVKGEINWDKAPVYRLEELFKRGNVIQK
jgi:hypothetical protein